MKLTYNSGDYLKLTIYTKHIKFEFRKTFDKILSYMKELQDEQKRLQKANLKNLVNICIENPLLKDEELDEDFKKNFKKRSDSYENIIYSIGIELLYTLQKRKLLHPGIIKLVNMNEIKWGTFEISESLD